MTHETDGRRDVGTRPDARAPRYFARQLSDLDFNDRLLDLVDDDEMPLLERVKFLVLFSERIDEFFQVQVAGLRRQVVAGIKTRAPTGSTPEELLGDVRGVARGDGPAPEVAAGRRAGAGAGRRGDRAVLDWDDARRRRPRATSTRCSTG